MNQLHDPFCPRLYCAFSCTLFLYPLKQFQSDCKPQLTRAIFCFITLKNTEDPSSCSSKGMMLSSSLAYTRSPRFLLLDTFAPLNCSEMQKKTQNKPTACLTHLLRYWLQSLVTLGLMSLMVPGLV